MVLNQHLELLFHPDSELNLTSIAWSGDLLPAD